MENSFSKSVERLTELAEGAIDLTNENIWTTKRQDNLFAESLGLKLFYATERVSEVEMIALADFARDSRAVEKMIAMQSGEVINRIEGYESENRRVLHTATRDFFDNQCNAEAAKEATSFAYQELERLRHFLHDIDSKQKFTTLVQIGIGGSHLGPEAVYVALQAYNKPNRHVYFLSNIDPDNCAQIFKNLKLEETLFVVVSKSGSTLETLTNETLVRDRLRRAGLDPKDHIVAITEKESPMDDLSKYLFCFYMQESVGGRFSVTSMVGGFALAFALGMDRFLDFLRGASAMDKIALKNNIYENLPLLSALLGVWNRNFLGIQTVAVIPYSQAMSRFVAHLQQLDMESNGKSIDIYGDKVSYETGPIIWGEVGTNSQHSFFQHLHQGTSIAAVEFLGFKESQYKEDILVRDTTSQEKLLSNMFAQSIALATGKKSQNPNKNFSGNRPNRILLADRLDPYTMGLILAYFEHKVAFQGFLWNINSFDQEGVQLGKELAIKMIDQFAQKRKEKSIDFKNFTLSKIFMKHLD